MDQIFNELSVSACYPDKFAAQEGMDLAIDVSVAMAKLGMSKNIRTTSDFTLRLLADGYSVAEWARDRIGNKEKKIYLLTFATKAPYIESFYEGKEQSDELFEFRFGQDLALGLGLAYLWNTSSISLSGDPRFIQENVILSEYRLTAEEVTNNNVSVFTFSNTHQVESHKDFILKSLQGAILNGQSLIENAQEMLPYLSFGPKTIDQVREFWGSEQFFHEVLNHLFILNKTMLEWTEGRFTPDLDFSPESESTMNNTEYAQKRLFLCKDGIERQFRLHSKIKSANKRIYFFPIPEQKIVHIGHVGDHLPTMKYGT
jgi:hypothetical protein